jgi:hypothetical protein
MLFYEMKKVFEKKIRKLPGTS